MVGNVGFVVFQGDVGAVTRTFRSDTLTITNGDGVDGDPQIEFAGTVGTAMQVPIELDASETFTVDDNTQVVYGEPFVLDTDAYLVIDGVLIEV